MRLERIHLPETSELEPRVTECLDEIEEGLQTLDNQVSIGAQGRPDILAVDDEGALVVLELKAGPASSGALDQGLRYLEWFSENPGLVSRTFPSIKPDLPVRLFIVATDFDASLLRLARYLSIDITLVKVLPVKNRESSEIGLLFDVIESEPAALPDTTFRSVEDIVAYISDSKVREEFLRILDHLRHEGVDVRPYRGGKQFWLECTHEGDDIGYFQSRRKYFRCQYCEEDKEDYIWPPIRLESFAEWEKQAARFFDACIRDAGGDEEGQRGG